MADVAKEIIKKYRIAVAGFWSVLVQARMGAIVLPVLIFLLFYLYHGLGLCSDDYYFYNMIAGNNFMTVSKSLFEGYHLLIAPCLFYYFLILKTIIVFNISLYSIWLMLMAIVVTYSIYNFMRDYTNRSTAFLFSFILFFYPTHDATVFWVLGMYIPINCGILMYAHHLINNGKYTGGLFVSFLGAFYSYASPAIGLGLSCIFLMKKRIKEFLIFVIPTIGYIGYGFIVKKNVDLTDWKFANLHNPFGILKQLFVQLCTAIDAFIGPSFFLKVYYAWLQLSVLSIFIGLLILILFIRTYDRAIKIQKIDRHVIWTFMIIIVLSSLQFSLTGRYPQIVFGLGNRVTFFVSLAAATVLLHLFSIGKKTGTIIFAIYLFTILGISDHWKEWAQEQKEIIARISANKDIKNITSKGNFFVSHNQYSRYGTFSHLELFSTSSREIFAFATGSTQSVYPIMRHYSLKEDYIIDGKYKQEFKIDKCIYIFNSSLGRLERIDKDSIEAYIEKLPVDKRHWIQFISNDILKNTIIKLSPELSYLFKS
jgi:hypothetical protein